MKIALAAVGFKNNNLAYNKEKIIELIKIYSKSADMILFGESFLQGFDCLVWNYEKDIVLWPVYTDFASFDWNNSDKYDYCKQALKCGKNVLYVNSVNLSCNDEESAKGGAAYFYNGQIKCEIPSGEEGVLVVEI